MSALIDDRYALVLWELAHEVGRLGDGVSGEAFVRIVGAKQKPSESLRPDRVVTLEAARKAFERIRKWALGFGLVLAKLESEDGLLPRVTFDRAAALELAGRLRPRLSRKVEARSPESPRLSPAVPLNGSASLMTFKSAASLLDVSLKTLRRKLSSRHPPIPVVRLDARIVRVKRSDVEAWIERSKGRAPKRVACK